MPYSCGAPDDWPRCAGSVEKKRCTRAGFHEVTVPNDRRACLCSRHHLELGLQGTTKIDQALTYAPGEKPPTRADDLTTLSGADIS